MITVRDVPAAKFIAEFVKTLKLNENFVVPAWSDIAKTGVHKELAPYDPDWYYIRAAAVIRKIYLRKGTGVGALRKRFGGCFRRGTRPEVHQDASGKIIRSILINLDNLKYTEATGKGGRQVSRVGQGACDLIAREIATSA